MKLCVTAVLAPGVKFSEIPYNNNKKLLFHTFCVEIFYSRTIQLGNKFAFDKLSLFMKLFILKKFKNT